MTSWIVPILLLAAHINSNTADNCAIGFWGPNCDKECSNHCKQRDCRESGLCEACADGRYSIRCDQKCPPNCLHEACFRYNVTCVHGCKSGYFGPKCLQRCPNGCLGGTCHQTTRECVPCNRRKLLRVPCSEQCEDGRHGTDCEQTCPVGCLVCVRAEGSCTVCAKGRFGRYCENECLCGTDGCDQSGACRIPVVSSVKQFDGRETDMTVTMIATAVGICMLLVVVFTFAIRYAIRYTRNSTKLGRMEEEERFIPAGDLNRHQPIVRPGCYIHTIHPVPVKTTA